jgi:hypothetical protein
LVYKSPTPDKKAPAIVVSSFPKVLGTPHDSISILGILYYLTKGVTYIAKVLEHTTKGLQAAQYLV